ncbi:class I SAM-dependent DNA methyltransferase [Lacticaseibacillus mingshuiensis]|uniref:Class I SAM-dependent DNA methyltransferase n=1 Tax=Lacticaseibacillus mingshuiensis TaxID=2799574 RepID=A0ABW4CJD2_9LACO|nr:class I SAM-dependent methyltransferase [Lacticaseibacillus mingshuiensis]
MIYTTFAEVYDRLMDDSLYSRWCDYVTARVAPRGQRLLELAGGSGSLAVLLAQAGFAVTDLDLSGDMLALAEPKIEAAGVDVPLVQGDMLALDAIGLAPFDVVTCFDDSLCYMPDLASVAQVFQQVAKLLPAGGDFFFDAHSLHQMDDIFPGFMYNDQTETQAFLWTSYEGEVPHSIEHDLTFFLYDEAIDAYHPLAETHKERTYPQADFEKTLAQAGFKLVSATADFGKATITPASTRWFFHARKE